MARAHPPVSALVLDLGNVLVFHDNTLLFSRLGERVGLDAARVQARLMGAQWDEANRGTLSRSQIREYIRQALDLKIADDALDVIWSSHFTFHDAMIRRVESLVRRVPLLLLSNTNALHVDWFRPKLPVLEQFKAVLLSCEEKLVKPERAFFERAIARAEVPASEMIFFDDIPEYVSAARSCGMRAHVFTTVEKFDADLRSEGFAD